MKKHKRSGFFAKLFVVLAILVAVVCGAYFAIDKLVVPKYFEAYGIHNMHELVGMMKTLYNSPDEKEFITNGYTKIDTRNANQKLINASVDKCLETAPDSGEVDYAKISSGDFSIEPGSYHFTDREVGSILNDMANSGVLASSLPNLKYLNDIDISVLEFIVTPESVEVDGKPEYLTNKADISCVFKIDTTLVRSKMAAEMDTPIFLLNMIIPKNMYIEVNYRLALNEQNQWTIENEDMAVNGRTVEQSEILINLMINFIFPEEDEMTATKLTQICGDILLNGIGLLGDLSFEYNIDSSGTNGIILTYGKKA